MAQRLASGKVKAVRLGGRQQRFDGCPQFIIHERVGHGNTSIAALGFTGDGQTMFVAYSRESASRGGRLIQIRGSDWQFVRTIELDDLNERFTHFNGDASLLFEVGLGQARTADDHLDI